MTFMSFSHSSRSLRSGKTYEQTLHPKMSVNIENITNASFQSNAQEKNPDNELISHELIGQRIEADLKPLNEQISTSTLLLKQLIRDNSGKTTPTAHSRAHRPHLGTLLDGETGAPRNSPDSTRSVLFSFLLEIWVASIKVVQVESP